MFYKSIIYISNIIQIYSHSRWDYSKKEESDSVNLENQFIRILDDIIIYVAELTGNIKWPSIWASKARRRNSNIQYNDDKIVAESIVLYIGIVRNLEIKDNNIIKLIS